MSAPRTLVLIEDASAPLTVAHLELLTLARGIGPVTAATFGEPEEDVLASLGAYGVEDVLVLDTAGDPNLTVVAAHALAAAVERLGAGFVFARATFANKETAALLALETGAGLIIDAARLEIGSDGSLMGAKRVFAGTWDVTFTNRTPLAVLTVRSNVTPALAAETPTAPAVSVHHVGAAEGADRVRLVSRTVHSAPESDDRAPALSDAPIVVAGGRGTFGDFGPVRDLADALGAAVGATRDCVDEGWIEHDAQIGQTGVTIAPRLYIGAGISGAPHHRGGMQASEVIVAVNNDPECPLFEICEFAVVGDLAQVLPEAARLIRKHREQVGDRPA